MNTFNAAMNQGVSEILSRFGVGSFGMVVFQVSEEELHLVKGLQRKTAVRVEEHQVAGAKPRLEFLAPELDVTNFTVFWHCGFGVNPRAEIRRLRELCTQGIAQRLIMGGENFGKHVLTEVTESWLRSGPKGDPMVAQAALTFKEYV